jgi:polyphosphate kinase
MLAEQGQIWQRELRPELLRQGHRVPRGAGLRRRRLGVPGRLLRPRDCAGAHAAGLRSRPSVSAHLESQQEPCGCREARRPHQIRARQATAHGPRDSSRSRSGSASRPTTFAFLEDVVCANVQSLFPGTQVKGAHLFRIVRDTDMVIQEDEADDLLETIDQGLASCGTAPCRCCTSKSGCRDGSWTSWSKTSTSTRACWSRPRTVWASATGWS